MKKKIKILQINSGNFGSTGNIMLNIHKMAMQNGFESYVAYPNSRTNRLKIFENSIYIGSILERNLHLQLAYYTGLNGCFSKFATDKFLKQVDKINPDIIHLHNLHNCYINVELLFNYIKDRNISVVWTLHDCWPFTGQCTHFTIAKCVKWKTGCFECPKYKVYPASIIDKTKKMYALKKKWFTGVKNLSIVTPSEWLACMVKDSFLNDYSVKVINNGIDLDVFKNMTSDFREKNSIVDKKILLGVANPWSEGKGLDIFIELAKKLDDDYKIVLVGLSPNQIVTLPSNIIGLQRIENTKELVKIYSAVDFFINPSREETMGLVTIEALACGTPAIVSNLTAVPETIDIRSGLTVAKYDVESFYNAIVQTKKTFSHDECRQQAAKFDMQIKYKEYIELYLELVKKTSSAGNKNFVKQL